MGTALLLALLWGGSLQEDSGYELHLQDPVTVQEGLCVLVNCSFSYPWSRWAPAGELYAYWYREGYGLSLGAVATNNQWRAVKAETRGRFRLLGDPEANNCSLSIRDARRRDTGTYYFRVERGERVRYSYRDKRLNLQVTALTQKPDIHLPEPLQAGSPANLTCSLPGSCEGGEPFLVTWVGDAVDSLDATTDPPSVLTLTPRPQDHGTNLTCRVTLRGPQVATERTIRLSISYPPRSVTTPLYQGNGTGSPPSCRCVTAEQQGSWPLILTLIRGTLMGAGFLLTYGLTWIYYSRGAGLCLSREVR
ncbi:Sialic Acid-Binding Ig-Like Lectin 14 [Manis pentadactyla]|nr:Sialic Acid-Binding Ig-Like Lectin 14 [Manis pentadactyla]